MKAAATVTVPLEVKPEVAVMSPEIVGVAVQAVPVTVRFPPKEVRLLPDTVKVLSKLVAPRRVKAPGVVVEPMVLMDEAPEPKVLVVFIPVAKVVLPEEVIVVNAPVEGVVAPIVVPLIVPPVIAEDEDAKLLAVTKPVPKVTGRLVVVLIDSVVAEVKSMMGLVAVKLVVTLFRVTIPVPVAKVLAPVTVVAPFKLTAPVPVLKVLAPV